MAAIVAAASCGGGASSGGGSLNSQPCPSQQPATLTCTDVGQECSYGSTQCRCDNAGWRCSQCPASAPLATDTCGATAGACSYGATQCVCGGAGLWDCLTCPASEPTNTDTCTPTGNGTGIGNQGPTCSYPNGAQCDCAGGRGGQAGTWNCTLSQCPAQEPQPGAACQIGRGTPCVYGKITCTCQNGGFYCI